MEFVMKNFAIYNCIISQIIDLAHIFNKRFADESELVLKISEILQNQNNYKLTITEILLKINKD